MKLRWKVFIFAMFLIWLFGVVMTVSNYYYEKEVRRDFGVPDE